MATESYRNVEICRKPMSKTIYKYVHTTVICQNNRCNNRINITFYFIFSYFLIWFFIFLYQVHITDDVFDPFLRPFWGLLCRDHSHELVHSQSLLAAFNSDRSNKSSRLSKPEYFCYLFGLVLVLLPTPRSLLRVFAICYLL